MTVPADLDLERELLGGLMLSPHAIDDVLAVTGPDDCYSPAHAAAFAAVIALHRRGERPDDPRAVVGEARTQGILLDPAEVVGWVAHGTFRLSSAAAALAELRLRRDLLHVSRAATEAAEGADPVGSVDALRSRLASLHTATSDVPASLLCAADVADTDHEAAPWVIPGLLRHGWRAMLVGFEGDGKTVALSQVGWCASQGLHPFKRTPIAPAAVLHVDLENTIDRVSDGYRPLVALCRRESADFDRTRMWVWHRPDGIDIRGRRDHGELEAILRAVRPNLVCLGPLRKAYRRRANENDEASSLDVQRVIDDLRHRYGFALLIEHHAPHTDGYGPRKPRPFGSSTWLGWPEFGRGMVADDKRPGVFALAKWRGDRVEADWPKEIHRGLPGTWPWDGVWDRNGGAF